MLMTKPPSFDHVTSRTNPHPPLSNQVLYQSNASRHKAGAGSKMGKNPNHQNHSVLSNASAMNFYPPFLQPTRMSDIVGAGSSNGSSNRAPSTRTSLKYSSSQSAAKSVSFYRSGDTQMQVFKVAITKRNFRTFDSLLESLTDRIPLPFGVRTISTPRGTHGISRLDEFEDGKSYVCSDKKTVKPLDLNSAKHPRPPWFISKPKTRTRVVAQLARRPDAESFRVPLRLTQVKTPKKIVIVRNGEPNFRHTLLLSRRTPQSFENILDDIGEIFRMRTHKLYTSDGRKIESLQSIYLGPTVFIAAGREAFQPMEYRVKKVAINDDKKDATSDSKNQFSKERTPKELKKTKGRWRVSIVTSELAAAATDAHVTITVYGLKGNTGPILLNGENTATFKSGNEDQFAINVGAIGEIRKVRIAHDNYGPSPGWLCESVTLTDATTGEILDFPCNRWLSRDEDDGEICREIPAILPDKPPLQVTNYLVSVFTGNLWNAGTTAGIYLTMFGELGDSGPRLLQHAGIAKPQIKGQTSFYKVEAVNLGSLHRIIIGHDEQNSGEGWFLHKIVVQEEQLGSEEWIFPCDRWLDSGEDDGKIVRELYSENDFKLNAQSRNRNEVERSRTDHMWDLEKWKFQKGNEIVFMSQATEKALRVRSDAAVDGLGDPSLPTSTFEVLRRRSNIRVFLNVGQPSFHLALDQNRTLGHGKGGSFCEFYVQIQPDRSVLLESCRNPRQYVTIDSSGKPADTRGHLNAPGKTFFVYVKGCFRNNSVILFNTSPSQVLAITSSGDVIGTGRRTEYDVNDLGAPNSHREKHFGHFRVVKVAEGVRMFQCEKDQKRFLRIKDRRCDGWGNGDVYCHFKVHKHKAGCYVTLESMKNRGVFIGLNTNGKARPAVDTGDVNNHFYPEVVSFGERRKKRPEDWKDLEPQLIIPTYDEKTNSNAYLIPSPAKSKMSVSTEIILKEREKSDTGPAEGDFRIYVTTGSAGMKEAISLFAYGDKGSVGPIVLGTGSDGGVFQCDQTDEFQANLSAAGKLHKIRIGAEEVTSDSEWRLKQVKMKEMKSSEVFRFKFNRWMSRLREDGATLREQPVTSADGKPVLPILRYHVIVRTSRESARLKPDADNNVTTQHQIYLCIHGENGDTGRRFLLRKPVEFPDEVVVDKPLFAPGQTDKFQIEAVDLGDLTKCVISCPNSAVSSQSSFPSWLCEEISIRESEGSVHEYVFRSRNKWLGVRKVGAKPQIKLELAEKREIKRNTSDEHQFKEGDWKVSVTTGSYENCGTSSNVMFYACGSEGTSSGPIFLGSGTKGLFRAGTTEQFKINVPNVKNFEKIRFTLDGSGNNPSWYLDRVKLQCLSQEISYSFEVRKWLSTTIDPYQMCVEIPVSNPGSELPSILRYQVLVYTGGILGSDTDANVFLTIYGKNGDTSRRSLLKSLNNDVKFQESQLDIFEVEAVDLGELTKIEIGHDGAGHGNGWFLHKVVIKESPMSSRDYVFFCNRWLDDGQDDGKIIRTIQAEPEEDEDDVQKLSSEGKYKVVITTGEQSCDQFCPLDGSVSLVIYGEEGKTGEVLLKPSQKDDDPEKLLYFKAGGKDNFQIDIPEVGRIYKIRLSLEYESNWKGWFVEKIILKDEKNHQDICFNCNRWLSKTEDDFETVREFAVASTNDNVLPVKQYQVCVTTGDRFGASTDANVYITLRGERGDSGERQLKTHNLEESSFQRNSTSCFTVEAIDLGTIKEVEVRHDGQGYGSGWFLEEIAVREKESATTQSIYPAHAWFDDHVGDCKTERRLRLLGEFDTTVDENLKMAKTGSKDGRNNETKNIYDVTVIVDEVMTQANSTIQLIGTVYGSSGKTGVVSLGDWRPGREKKFFTKADLGEIEDITKLRVEMVESHLDQNLLLITVSFKKNYPSKTSTFHFDRHFRSSSGSTVKELPACSDSQLCLRHVNYLVSVDMSPIDDEIPSQGKIQIRLSGSNGDSGLRSLFNGMEGFNATKNSSGYVFEHESVDLGELNEISLVYLSDDDVSEGGWKIGEVVVKEIPTPNFSAVAHRSDTAYIASVDCEFDPNKKRNQTFFLQQINLDSKTKTLFKDFNKHFIKPPLKEIKDESEGRWRLELVTSSYDQVSLYNQIGVRVFGTLECTDVTSLSSSDAKNISTPGKDNSKMQLRTMDLQLGTDLGQVYQVRVIMHQECLVKIYKLKLTDLTTNETFVYFLSPDERSNPTVGVDGTVSYNVPLVKPDEKPFLPHLYKVKVRTGDKPSANSDADINLEIFGKTGSTGPRSLRKLSKDPDELFQLERTDSFVIETTDIGEPEKIVLSHSAFGMGAGWFPVDVTINEIRADVESTFIFSCLKWLDDSVNENTTQHEFFVSGTRTLQPQVDVSQSSGSWKCYVIVKPEAVAQSEIDMKFTFCLSEEQTRVHSICIRNLRHEFPMTLSESADDTKTRFVKLRTEIEEMTDYTKKNWPLLEFFMVNEKSNEKIRFIYDKAPVWDGSGRDNVRELPVVRSHQSFQPVHDYYVIFCTSDQSHRDFAPTSVSCQLRGKNGATGWRQLVSKENVDGKFRPGRIDMFPMESVSLGDAVTDVMIRAEGPFKESWFLERVRVKRGFYDEEENVFDCEREILENETVELPLSKTDYSYQPLSLPKLVKSRPEDNVFKYDVTITWEGLSSLVSNWKVSNNDRSAADRVPTFSVQLGGTKGCSSVASLPLNKKPELRNGNTELELQISTPYSSFGNLVKVGLGMLDPALPLKDPGFRCFLKKVSIRNVESNQYYFYKLNHNFFGKTKHSTTRVLTGLNWIELAATQPKQDPSTIAQLCYYVIKLTTTDHADAGTSANVYVTLIGQNGDSGKRWLMTPSDGSETEYNPGSNVEYVIESTFLDDLQQVIIGHDGRDIASAWYLDNVTVTSSVHPKQHYVFNCKKWLADLQEDTFIERTLTLDHMTTDDQ